MDTFCNSDQRLQQKTGLVIYAELLIGRYGETNSTTCLDAAIAGARNAVNITPKSHREYPLWLFKLGRLLQCKSLESQDLTDFEKSIDCMKESIKLIPENDEHWADWMFELNSVLWNKYLRTRAAADFNAANQTLRQSVDAIASPRPQLLKDRIDSLDARLKMSHGPVDLDEAIKMSYEAVAEARQNDPEQTLCFHLQNLGAQLDIRYARYYKEPDLDQAIRIQEEVLDLTPLNHTARAYRLQTLARRYGFKFHVTNTICHLGSSIQLYGAALNLIPDSYPFRARWTFQLANVHGSRYQRMGSKNDLQKQFELYKKALEIISPNDPDRYQILRHLGLWHRDNASQRNPAGLDEALRIFQKCVDNKKEMIEEDYIFTLEYIADAYMTRWSWREKTQDVSDINKAIQFSQQALDLSLPLETDFWIYRLRKLASLYKTRYSTTGTHEDFEVALATFQRLLDNTPSTHVMRAEWVRQSVELWNIDDPRRIPLLLEATKHPQSSIKSRLYACGSLLTTCVLNESVEATYECACTTVNLLQSLVPHYLETSDKQHNLRNQYHNDLAAAAAVAILYTEKAPLEALQILEKGRGLLSTSLDNLNTSTADLRGQYPDLADKLLNLQKELKLPLPTASISLNERVNRRQIASAAFDKVVAEVRLLPGFEQFLLPPTEKEVYVAAENGPIVVIVPSHLGSAALLIHEYQVQSLYLPDLTIIKIQEMRAKESQGLGDPRTLEWLWDMIAAPILNKLGINQPASDENWPHIWWIPTGILSQFPIHAAGYHGKDHSRTVLDRVISSYSPSIKAIINSRQRYDRLPPGEGQALLVGIENAQGHTSLRHVKKEISMLQELCKSMELRLIESAQNKSSIVLYLPRCSIFHFAGHGYCEEADPSNSCLVLEDGQIKVSELLDMNFQQSSPFLGYLSACGTGRNRDVRSFDENIHLIRAFQLAGFRHVVGTLWNVQDEICVDVARITYETIKEQGFTDEAVCYGVHKASRELRDRWLQVQMEVRGQGSILKLEGSLEKQRENTTDEQTKGQPSRNVHICEDEITLPAFWAPYVHYGV